jgi:uncharacterized membrane protein
MRAARPHWLALSVAAVSLAAAAASLASAPTVIRAPLVLVFTLVGPGAALTPLLELADPLAEFSLAVGVSLALDVVIALVMLYAHAWTPEGALAILAAVSLAGAGAQVISKGRA